MKMKVFNFLYKIATDCKFWSYKCSFYFDLLDISEDTREFEACKRLLLFLKIIKNKKKTR